MTSKRGYKLSALFIALGLAWSVQAQEQEQEQEQTQTREEILAEHQQQALDQNQPADFSSQPFTDLLSSEPRFSRFHQALELTDMLEELNELEDATIFVPFDEAFSRLPAGIWEAWQQGDGHDELREILQAHIVIDERISRDDATDSAQSYTTLAGTEVEIRSMYGALMVDTVSVNVPDLATNQGYVHGIDSFIWDMSDLDTDPVEMEEPEEPQEPDEIEDEQEQSNG